MFGLLCVILNSQGPPGEKGEKGDLGFPGLQVFPKLLFSLSLTKFECWIDIILNLGHIFETVEKRVVGVNLNWGESGIQGMLVCSDRIIQGLKNQLLSWPC